MQISPYLVPDSLPRLLKDCLTIGKNPDEQDILLMSVLTGASACLPNLVFRYGHTGKTYHPNMQTFVMAGSASGKGVANMALGLVAAVEEKYGLLIPGDSTYPAFFQALYEHDGFGYVHESEGSVITDIWKSGAATYNTALRKAAEHEPISRNRVLQGTQSIQHPQLSMLLTGTFDQFKTLVPSVQNGYFSRLSVLVVRGRHAFDPSVFAVQKVQENTSVKTAGHRLLHLYEELSQRETPIELVLTGEQAEKLGRHFAKQYEALVGELGDNFHPSVVRAGVTVMRVASILTALRKATEETAAADQWACTEEDFNTALLISSKLLLHSADAYLQIEGDKEKAVPEQEMPVQQQTLYCMLPEAFNTGECLAYAHQIGMADRTVKRWLSHWSETGKLQHVQHGEYKKVS